MKILEIGFKSPQLQTTSDPSATVSTSASGEVSADPNIKFFAKNLPGFNPSDPLHKSWSVVYAKQKYDAKRSGKEWDIDIKYAWDLINQQNWKCALSGDKFTPAGTRALTQASMDRIDSAKGYVKGNVQFLTLQVNLAKRNMSDSGFIDMCKKVAKNVSSS